MYADWDCDENLKKHWEWWLPLIIIMIWLLVIINNINNIINNMIISDYYP